MLNFIDVRSNTSESFSIVDAVIRQRSKSQGTSRSSDSRKRQANNGERLKATYKIWACLVSHFVAATRQVSSWSSVIQDRGVNTKISRARIFIPESNLENCPWLTFLFLAFETKWGQVFLTHLPQLNFSLILLSFSYLQSPPPPSLSLRESCFWMIYSGMQRSIRCVVKITDCEGNVQQQREMAQPWWSCPNIGC